MANSHGVPDTMYEIQALSNDLLPACIVSTTFPAVPAPPSLTLAAFATAGFVKDGPTLVYVTQEAHTVVLTGGDGNYWLALGQDTWASVASWNRTNGTHYLWRPSATQPPDVDGLLVWCQLTVVGGAITVVTPLPSVTSTPMSKQLSGAVAITGGTLATMGASTFGGPVQVAGNTSIGSVTDANVILQLSYDKATRFGMAIRPLGSDTGNPAITFQNIAAGTVGNIVTTASTTAYNTSSDRRLKHAISPLTDALERVRALRPISHRWNVDDSPGEGFLAHELMGPCLLAVTGLPDEVNDDGSVKPQQVDHSKLIPLLTAGLQAALAQIDALTARITTLEDALGA